MASLFGAQAAKTTTAAALPTGGATSTSSAAAPAGGLGGYDSTAFSAAAASLVRQPGAATATGALQHGAQTQVQNPKDTDVPPELMQLFNDLSKCAERVNGELDQCAAEGDCVEKCAQIGADLNADAARLASYDSQMHRLEQRLAELKARTRNDCRTAESEKRRTIGGPESAAGRRLYEPLALLHGVLDEHESAVVRHRQTLAALEAHVAVALGGTGANVTAAGSKSLLDRVQQFDGELRTVAERVYTVHQLVEEEHERVLSAGRSTLLSASDGGGDARLSRILNAHKETAGGGGKRLAVPTGPDVLHNASLAALINVADQLATAHPASVSGMPAAGQPLLAFGQQQQQQPAALFGATAAAPFASSLSMAKPPAFGSTFGAGNQTAGAFKSTGTGGLFGNSSTGQPGVLQSSRSGTLFSGVATVRPFS